MLSIILKTIAVLVLTALAFSSAAVAQDVRVDVGKHASRIPKSCETVIPASIDGQIDITSLVKEAICRGAGDMLTEYTYTIESTQRVIDKKGNVKEATSTHEVFIPTLKPGMHARGVLILTSRNGIPVAPEEMEKERRKAGERLEKEEAKIEREHTPLPAEETTKGMTPIGMYSRMAVHRSSLGSDHTVALTIHTFLKTCELKFLRRATNEEREALVFSFEPRPDAQFGDDEKYVAQLNGEIWIDVQDRIATRLVGWPTIEPNAPATVNPSPASKNTPAVYFEMTRLKEGTWLPRVARINAADYPKLFNGITTDSTSTYGNYIRFTTEIKDVKVDRPNS